MYERACLRRQNVQILDGPSASLIPVRPGHVEEVAERVEHATRNDEAILDVEIYFGRAEGCVGGLNDDVRGGEVVGDFEGHGGQICRFSSSNLDESFRSKMQASWEVYHHPDNDS